jgi:hypothetical protein
VSEPAFTLDLEVAELLADEPALIAIADAVAATQRRPLRRRRLPALIGLVAVGLGAAAGLLTLLPHGGARGSLLPQALAAVGTGAVVHARIETRLPGTTVVDLRTGRTTPQTAAIEYWYDEERGQLRREMRRGGALVDGGASSAAVEPGLAAFVRGYRHALATGAARRLDDGVVAGRRVAWLQLGHGPYAERVAVDAAAYTPVLVIPQGSGLAWRVRLIESTDRKEADFAPRALPARPFRGDVTSSRPVSSGRLRGSLWLGESWRGLRLVSLERQTLSRGYPPGQHGAERGTGVHMRYAADGLRRYVEVSVARAPEPAYAFTGGAATFDGNPIPAEGKMEIARLAGSARQTFIGQLRRDGGYVTIWSGARVLCLQAARELRRIGNGAR